MHDHTWYGIPQRDPNYDEEACACGHHRRRRVQVAGLRLDPSLPDWEEFLGPPPLSRSRHIQEIERLQARVAALTAALQEARQWIQTGCDHFQDSEAVVRYLDQVLNAAAGS